MKKRTKVILLSIAGVLVLSLLLWKFGWRLAGTALCEPVDALVISSVTEEDGQLVIRGLNAASSIDKYEGNVQRRQGTTVTLGIKMRPFFANTDTSSFTIRIPDAANTKEVYLADGQKSRRIYPPEETE